MVHDKGWVLPFVLPFEAVVQACCNPPSRPPGPRRLRHHRPPHRRHHQLAVIAAAAAVGCPRRRRLLQTWVGFGAGTEAAEVDAASRQLTAAPRSTVGRQPAPPPTAAAEVACPQQLCCAQRFRQPRQPRLHGGLQGRLRRRGALRVVAARRQKATAATMTARPLSSNTMSAYPPPSSRSPARRASRRRRRLRRLRSSGHPQWRRGSWRPNVRVKVQVEAEGAALVERCEDQGAGVRVSVDVFNAGTLADLIFSCDFHLVLFIIGKKTGHGMLCQG